MNLISRTTVVLILCVVILLGMCFALAGQSAGLPIRANSEPGKYALIYNGPVSAEDCPEAAAAIATAVGLKVRFVSNVGELPNLLKDTAVFIIGGTEDDLHPLLIAFTP